MRQLSSFEAQVTDGYETSIQILISTDRGDIFWSSKHLNSARQNIVTYFGVGCTEAHNFAACKFRIRFIYVKIISYIRLVVRNKCLKVDACNSEEPGLLGCDVM